jgi:hypothetical protein
MSLHLLQDERPSGGIVVEPISDEDEALGEIRCPLCGWRPSASSRWCCLCAGTPEPPFDSCGTVWNTFSTGGRCPGCDHQWQWTSCLRCAGWSPHVDWYESRES